MLCQSIRGNASSVGARDLESWAEEAVARAGLGDPVWRGVVSLEVRNIADNQVLLD
jgi:hypothetical protein